MPKLPGVIPVTGTQPKVYFVTLIFRRRPVHVVNLDPAAEYFDYEPLADIRDLIKVDDAMEDEELRF